jgi:putative cardiolipin synthase
MYGPIADAVKSVTSELLMITPYLVPAPEEMDLLRNLRLKDIRVRILTNSLNSNNELTAHAGYTHYRRRLLEDGVELHEVRALLSKDSRGSGQGRAISRFGNYGLHAKLFVFDRSSVYAGSMNFDQRSRRLNTETGLIIDSPELAQQITARYELMTRLTSSYAVMLKSTSGMKASVVWDTIENDQPVEYRREPSDSSWRRAEVRMLSMLPIDGEL